MFNHVVYKTFPRDFSRRSRSVVVKEMYQKAWRMSVNSCCFAHISRRRGYLSPPPPTQYIHQQLSQYWCFVSNSQDLFTLHENSLCLTHDLLQCTCMASEVGISIYCGNEPINIKGVAVVYSLNKLKLGRRFIEEQVRIERLERIVFIRVSFIRWAFGYCIYLCYIRVSSMQKFLCSSPLPHYFAYFLFPSFCPFEYPTMNNLWCDPGSRSDPYLDKFCLWSLWLHFRRYVNNECYLLCAELSLLCPLW